MELDQQPPRPLITLPRVDTLKNSVVLGAENSVGAEELDVENTASGHVASGHVASGHVASGHVASGHREAPTPPGGSSRSNSPGPPGATSRRPSHAAHNRSMTPDKGQVSPSQAA